MWNFWRPFYPEAFSVMAFAIIKTGGRQYRVAEGDTIDVDLLEGEAGTKITFGDVLTHVDSDKIEHGAPLDGTTVTGEIVEHRKDKKVIAFKFRRRKGYHRTVGHRRKLTRVKITGIKTGAAKSKTKGTAG
jgi:large subunit ribosomal protein L21